MISEPRPNSTLALSSPGTFSCKEDGQARNSKSSPASSLFSSSIESKTASFPGSRLQPFAGTLSPSLSAALFLQASRIRLK